MSSLQTYLTPSAKYAPVLFVSLTVLAGLVLHTAKLESVPPGLSGDEVSIGYDAYLISQTLKDQHGRFLPAVFESSGDWKDPGNIYATALLFAVAEPSVLLLRLTSVFFFSLLMLLMFRLLQKIYGQLSISLFAVLAIGTLPWFFVLTRLAWPAAMYLAVVGIALFLTYKTFEEHRSARRAMSNAVFAGFCTTASVYVYHSAKVLAPLMVLTVILLYAGRSWRRVAAYVAGAFAGIAGFLWEMRAIPDQVGSRFYQTTFLYDAGMSIWEKGARVFDQYLLHFGREFLLVSGDVNLRHASGFIGELYLTVLALALVGIVSVLVTRRHRRFHLFLLGNLLAAPLPAAVTHDGVPHSTRTVVMGLYFILFAAGGLALLSRSILEMPVRRSVVALAFIALCFESTAFTHRFFDEYPARSADSFDVIGLREMLEKVEAMPDQEKIVISKSIDEKATNFLARSIGITDRLTIVERDSPEPEECMIRQGTDELDGNAPKETSGKYGLFCREEEQQHEEEMHAAE